MDVGVQNNFETLLSVLCGIYPEVELLDFMLILCLIFEELPYSFPQWLFYLTFLPTVHKLSSFSLASPTLAIFWVLCVVVVCCLVFSHLNEGECILFIATCSIFIFHEYNTLTLRILVQFSSITQSCPIFCNPKDCSMPGLPVHHQLPEFTQTHVHWFGDAIQPSHPLSSPSSPAFNLSQHQGLFQ